MIRHVVLLTWNEGVTDDHVATVCAGLARLPGLIPEIVGYEFGRDLGFGPANADFAIAATFASSADYEVYATHPEHVAVIERDIAPIRAHRRAVQFETGG